MSDWRTEGPRDATLPCDLMVEVDFDYEPHEPEVCFPNERAHPGADARVSAVSVILKKDGQEYDLIDCLNDEAIEAVEDQILREINREPDEG